MADFERLPSSRGVGGIAGGLASGQSIHAGAGLLGVPLYEPSLQQLLLDRGKDALDRLIGRGKEPHERHHQQRRIQLLRPEVLL